MDKLKRYELINQLLILEKLYPEEADYYAAFETPKYDGSGQKRVNL